MTPTSIAIAEEKFGVGFINCFPGTHVKVVDQGWTYQCDQKQEAQMKGKLDI